MSAREPREASAQAASESECHGPACCCLPAACCCLPADCPQAECQGPDCPACLEAVQKLLSTEGAYYLELNPDLIPPQSREAVSKFVNANAELANALNVERIEHAADIQRAKSDRDKLKITKKLLNMAREESGNARILNADLLAVNNTLRDDISRMQTAMNGAHEQLLRLAAERSVVTVGISAVEKEVDRMREADELKLLELEQARAEAAQARAEAAQARAEAAQARAEAAQARAEAAQDRAEAAQDRASLADSNKSITKLLEKKDVNLAKLLEAKDIEMAKLQNDLLMSQQELTKAQAEFEKHRAKFEKHRAKFEKYKGAARKERADAKRTSSAEVNSAKQKCAAAERDAAELRAELARTHALYASSQEAQAAAVRDAAELRAELAQERAASRDVDAKLRKAGAHIQQMNDRTRRDDAERARLDARNAALFDHVQKTDAALRQLLGANVDILGERHAAPEKQAAPARPCLGDTETGAKEFDLNPLGGSEKFNPPGGPALE